MSQQVELLQPVEEDAYDAWMQMLSGEEADPAPPVAEIQQHIVPMDQVRDCKKGERMQVMRMTSSKAGGDQLLPFQSVNIIGRVDGPVATLNIDLHYKNPDEQHPIECSYEFPLDKNTVFAKLVCKIEDKETTAIVKNKEEAKKEYEEAIASGQQAVYAERESDENETMTIKLGNLKPQQSAKLSIQLIFMLDIVCGSYKFFLPVDFYPDYRNLGSVSKTNLNYSFKFQLTINSTKEITKVSLPPSTTKILAKGRKKLSIGCKKKPNQEMLIFFQTAAAMDPILQYAVSHDEQDVAVSATFVPSFEPKAPQEATEVLENEEPPITPISDGKDFLFVFLVDRSGSMSMNNRINITVNALKLFLRSLPVNSYFSVVSFGSQHEFMAVKGSQTIAYNDENVKEALAQIESFTANFGGTNILTPLQDAQKVPTTCANRRIFLLTDGMVKDPQIVEQAAAANTDMNRVFTFGIGNDCDKNMVQMAAKLGRGKCFLVGDNMTKMLNSSVVRSIECAFEPSLKNCSLAWNGVGQNLAEVFRNQMIHKRAIVPAAQWGQFKMTFKSELDPQSNTPIEHTWDSNHFVLVENKDSANALFQMAALDAINNGQLTDQQKIGLSVKHQVLCDLTAMVGVIHLVDPVTGERKEFKLDADEEQKKTGEISEEQKKAMLDAAKAAKNDMAQKNAAASASATGPTKQDIGAQRGSVCPAQEMEKYSDNWDLFVEWIKEQGDSHIAEMKEKLEEIDEDCATGMYDEFEEIDFNMGFTNLTQDCQEQILELLDGVYDQPGNFWQQKQELPEVIPPTPEQLEAIQRAKEFEEAARVAKEAKKARDVIAHRKANQRVELFEKIISLQSIEGIFDIEGIKFITLFLKGDFEDPAVLNELMKDQEKIAAHQTEKMNLKTIYLTILCLYILREQFEEEKDQWQVIARKAKTALKKAGVSNPDGLTRSFSVLTCWPELPVKK